MITLLVSNFRQSSLLQQAVNKNFTYIFIAQEEEKMMKETETFLRTEEKFDLTEERAAVFLDEIKSYIVPDVYPSYTLHSLYYDTDNYAMISHCLNHPCTARSCACAAMA